MSAITRIPKYGHIIQLFYLKEPKYGHSMKFLSKCPNKEITNLTASSLRCLNARALINSRPDHYTAGRENERECKLVYQTRQSAEYTNNLCNHSTHQTSSHTRTVSL
jgi:hypothetical protein